MKRLNKVFIFLFSFAFLISSFVYPAVSVSAAGITPWKIRGQIFGTGNQMIILNPSMDKIIVGDSIPRYPDDNSGSRIIRWYLSGNASSWTWNGSAWTKDSNSSDTVSLQWTYGSSDVYGYSNFGEDVYWMANWRGHVSVISATTPNVSSPISLNSDIVVKLERVDNNRIFFTVKAPTAFPLPQLTTYLDLYYSLPSNRFADDLYADYQSLLSGSSKRIVNSFYKKSYDYTGKYSMNFPLSDATSWKDSVDETVTSDGLLTDVTTHVYTTYFMYIDVDKVTIGNYVNNQQALSHISTLTPLVDMIVSNGYFSSVRGYVMTPNSQSGVNVTLNDESGNVNGNYYVDKLAEDITQADITDNNTLAYLEKIEQQRQEMLDWYKYSDDFQLDSDVVGGFDGILHSLRGLVSSFQGIGSLVASFFSFLPREIVAVLAFGIIAMVFISLYKALRG